MPLPTEFIEQIKDRNRIEDVMRSYVTLKRAGRRLVCLCPFHSEKTPSCTVYTDDGTFHCFGCGTGGDVINFIRKIENLEYIEAVRFLAQRAGLPMPEDGYDDRAARDRARLLEINKAAARFFYSNLTTPDGSEGLRYLVEKRRLTPKTIKSFGLGVAPNRWTSLKNHMLANGFTERELVSASLLGEKNGRTYDFFVNRVIFPIFDLRGNVIAFSGRILDPDPKGGKYLNSRETMLYRKSRTLFALNFAKNVSVKSKRLILCEGNVDVITLHQAGFTEAVATCGTAITAEHARLMSQYCDEVYICYDADEAGQKATKSAIQILSAAGLSAKVVRVAGDGVKDVDDYIRKFGPEHFKVLLSGSVGSTDYELANAKSGLDTSSDVGRVEYLKRAIGVLASVENRIEREVYISRVASEQGVSKETVSAEVNAIIRKRDSQESKKEWNRIVSGAVRDDINPEAKKYPKQARAEEGVIAFLFTHPDGADEVFKALHPDEFVTSFNKKVYQTIIDLKKAGSEIGLGELGSEFSADEVGRISTILVRAKEIAIDRDALADYIRVIKKGVIDTDTEDMSNDDFLKYYQELSKTKKE